MYCIKLVIPILQNNCYSKFLKLLENNVNFLKQNHFIKKQNICSANKTKSPYSKNRTSVLLINITFLYKDFQYLSIIPILDHLLPFLRAFILRGIIIYLIT